MKHLLIGLLIYWTLCVALAFRKGIFVNQLREALPQLFILPAWMRACIMFLVFIVMAPMVLKEPFVYLRHQYMNMKLRRITRGIRKMSKDKAVQNQELASDLSKIADNLDEISKA